MPSSPVLTASLSLLLCLNDYVAAFPARIGPDGTLVLSPQNTISASTPAGPAHAPNDGASAQLKTNLTNLLDSMVYAYIPGLNSNGQLVFVNSAGQMTFPDTSSLDPESIDHSTIAIPIGPRSSSIVTIPGYLNSSRVWLAEDQLQFSVFRNESGNIHLVEPSAVNPDDPNTEINYGFAELTWSEERGLWANPTYVDFVGLPVGIKLSTIGNNTEQEVLGLPSDAVRSIHTKLKDQAEKDGQPWDQGCTQGSNNVTIRILSPYSVMSLDSEAFDGFYDSYVREVFARYANEPLTIDTQCNEGLVKCRTNLGSMTMSCDGDSNIYAAPTTADIFGCSTGPFKIIQGGGPIHMNVVPRLCAAFNRGTLLLGTSPNVTMKQYDVAASGSIQPGLLSNSYYTNAQSGHNVYAAAVHRAEWEGKGYAFSYDDVNASEDDNVAGVLMSEAPDTLTIMIGGYDLE